MQFCIDMNSCIALSIAFSCSEWVQVLRTRTILVRIWILIRTLIEKKSLLIELLFYIWLRTVFYVAIGHYLQLNIKCIRNTDPEPPNWSLNSGLDPGHATLQKFTPVFTISLFLVGKFCNPILSCPLRSFFAFHHPELTVLDLDPLTLGTK
jgi:hypothetical protein